MKFQNKREEELWVKFVLAREGNPTSLVGGEAVSTVLRADFFIEEYRLRSDNLNDVGE